VSSTSKSSDAIPKLQAEAIEGDENASKIQTSSTNELSYGDIIQSVG
jgi:hypothetical protein